MIMTGSTMQWQNRQQLMELRLYSSSTNVSINTRWKLFKGRTLGKIFPQIFARLGDFFRALMSSHVHHQGEHQHYQEAASSPGANVDYYQLPGHLYGGAYFHGWCISNRDSLYILHLMIHFVFLNKNNFFVKHGWNWHWIINTFWILQHSPEECW